MTYSAAHASPISSHPAFPAAIALWFAALFGLGLYVMPGAIHDALAQTIGLGRLGVEFAPPVGTTGRALIATLAALLGAGFGLVIAGRVRVASAGTAGTTDYDELETGDEPVATDAKEEPVRRRFLNLREEIAEQGIDPATDDDAGGATVLADAADAMPVDPLADEEDALFVDAVAAPTPPPFDEWGLDDADAAASAPLPDVEAEAGADTSTSAELPTAAERSLGDLPLAELTARLERALAGYRLAAPQDETAATGEETQTALRSALDRLTHLRISG